MTGKQIQSIRQALGMSRAEFARKLGVSRSTVLRCEQTGRTKQTALLAKLSELQEYVNLLSTPHSMCAELYSDPRGNLSVWTTYFPSLRVFSIRDVPKGELRGGHAHRTCYQIILCMSGSFDLCVTARDGRVFLFTMGGHLASHGVYVPPMHWIQLSNFNSGVAVVLCSEAEYKTPITDFEKFKRMK